MTLVAILTVRREALDKFRDYERRTARIMARHGGSIDHTVVASSPETDPHLKEVHLVRFPDQQSFQAYRNDPDLAAISHLRDESVVSAEVLTGEDGPSYR